MLQLAFFGFFDLDLQQFDLLVLQGDLGNVLLFFLAEFLLGFVEDLLFFDSLLDDGVELIFLLLLAHQTNGLATGAHAGVVVLVLLKLTELTSGRPVVRSSIYLLLVIVHFWRLASLL